MKLALSVLAVLSVAAPAAAAPQVQAAWSRPAAQGGAGAGFMVLANPDAKPDALVAVQSPLAREVQIHQSSMANGIASMRRLDRVPLAAGARVTFAPGGYHLMLLGLTKALKAGDAVPATLTFASGAKVTASFVVGSGPPAAPAHNH